MLYLNGVHYTMKDKEKAELRKLFSFPIKVTYPEGMVKPGINALPDQPKSIGIPCRSHVRTKHGDTEEWRWASTTNIDRHNRTKFTPRNLAFMGSMMLNELDIELVYFLYHKSPHCANGDPELTIKKKSYFMIEDLVKIASTRVNNRATLARYDVMLYDDEIGLDPTLIRQIAKAYFIPDVDGLHIDQVRVAIDLTVKRDTKTGIQNFMELSKSNEKLTARVKIQSAIDLRLIYFYARERMWRWTPAQGEKPENLCKVLAKVMPQNALIEWYNGDVEFRERLDRELNDAIVMKPTSKDLETEQIVGSPNS